MNKIIDFNKVKNKEITRNLIMKIILFLTLIYIIYAIYLIVRTPNDTVVVKTGTLTEEEMATGIVIREEYIIKGQNYKNGVYQILVEGERAAKNQTIFRYYGKSENEIQEEIEEINLKIQEALTKEENSIFSSDIKSLESKIDDKIKNLKEETDIQTITEYKKEISDIISKKATIIGETSQSGSYIKKLIAQKEEYEKKLIEGSEYMNASVSGVVSYRVDGLENVLSINNFDSLTSNELNNLDVKTGKIVSTSNECAKIINNFECYIATLLESDVSKSAEEGDNIKITLSSGDEVSAQVYKINEENDGKKLIILKLNTLTDELISYRKISFNITWWSYSRKKST